VDIESFWNHYIQQLMRELAYAKDNKRKGVFRINEKLPDALVKRLEMHVSKYPEYNFEAKKCYQCASTWDIMITLRNG